MKILFLLATLTLLASCTNAPETTPAPAPASETKMMKADEVMPDAMMKTEEVKDAMMMSGEMMDTSGMEMPQKEESKMMKATGYMNNDEMKVKEALASGQKVALFFHATWCPTCRSLDSAITSDLWAIPSDTLIVKVDYDNSTEMKKKYGVTSQHTTVLIDKDRAFISKKLGAKSVSDILN
jgi:thiol-disulfide isomerase/thioredoxin